MNLGVSSGGIKICVIRKEKIKREVITSKKQNGHKLIP